MYLNLTAYNKSKSRRKKSKKPKGEVYQKYVPKKFEPYEPTPSAFARETPNYPSVSSNTAINTSKPERKEYTGTLVKGIATMHKSNAVPIINDEEAKDISRMRRG